MADYVGQQLGNYRLLSLLGEGGFAEVYLGEHIHLNTQAAIKVLHTQLASNDIELFRNEARIIAHLFHPHIVRVLEFGVEGKIPFLVMDFAPNGTLRKLHPKGTQVPVATVVNYVKQVADALQYAHDEKLIHRDIKPENMLLGRRQEVLLSDFGIALVTQSSRYQSTKDMAGTIAYMAPEQIEGHPRPASDQYSLGIVVYEWLSGDRPFHGSFTEVAIKHSLAPPPSLCEKVPSIPPAIEYVVMKALAKDPKQRFARIQAFAAALGHACHISPETVISPGQPLQPPDANFLLTQPSMPTELVTPLSQSAVPTEMVTPLGLSSLPPAPGTPLSRSTLPSSVAHLSNESFLPSAIPLSPNQSSVTASPSQLVQPPVAVPLSRKTQLSKLIGLSRGLYSILWLLVIILFFITHSWIVLLIGALLSLLLGVALRFIRA